MKKVLLLLALLLATVTAHALPFVTTSSISTYPIHWYQLKINDKYVYYDPDGDIFNQIQLTPTASSENNFLWCFVQTSPDKILIYNRAAQQYLKEDSYVTSDMNSSYISYVEERASGGFYIKYYHQGDGRYYYLYESIGDDYDVLSSAAGALSSSVFNAIEVLVEGEGDIVPVTELAFTPYDVYTPNNVQTDSAENYLKLFDKNKNTKWVVDNNTGSWEAIWVDFKSNEAFIPTSYTMTTGNDTQSWSGRNPKKWKIYAKAHETDDWTTIVDVTDGAAAGLGTANTTDYSFNIDGVSSPYQYFRFEVSEVRGQGGWQNDHYVFQLAELALSGLISAEPSGDIEFSELEVYDDYCIIQASYTGDEAHTLKLFVNGTETENPYTVSRAQETQTLNIVANVEFTDPTISTITASTTYEIPALETHSWPYATTTWGSTEPIQWYYLITNNNLTSKLCVANNSGNWELRMYGAPDVDESLWCFVQMPSGRIALVNKAAMQFLNNGLDFTLDQQSFNLNYVVQNNNSNSFYICYDYQNSLYYTTTMYFNWTLGQMYPSYSSLQNMTLYAEAVTVQTYSNPAGQVNFSNLNVQDESCSFTCAYSGNESHTLKVYINGTQVENASQYTIERTNQAQEVTVRAEVFFNGNIFPMYSEKTYQVPALDEPVPEPVDQTLTPYDVYAPNNAQTDPAQDYHKLFDKDKSTKWCVDNSTGSWETIWVDFKSNEAFIPTSYTMTTGNDTQSWSGRNPKKWKIYAKAHETDEWTTIVDVTDGAAAGLGTANTTDYSFNIDGVSSPYQYFRFEVSEVRGQGGWQSDHYVFQLAELFMSGYTLSTAVSGDANSDNKVDVNDVTAVINYILGKNPTPFNVNNANVNGDAKIDVLDVPLIINIILGIN